MPYSADKPATKDVYVQFAEFNSSFLDWKGVIRQQETKKNQK
jgi:hypothetical protein